MYAIWDTVAVNSEGSDAWTPAQVAEGKRRIKAWETAAALIEGLRREELRRSDPYQQIALLCGPADYRTPPRAPKPTSGLIEQQRWFKKAAGHD